MVFCAYHWLVYMDGTMERLLQDNEVGWHAGKWDVNCKSVAICLDDDFENLAPQNIFFRQFRISLKTLRVCPSRKYF